MSRRGSEWARRCPQSARLELELERALCGSSEWGARRLGELEACCTRQESEHRAMGRRWLDGRPWHYSRTRREAARMFLVRACVEAIRPAASVRELQERLDGLRTDFLLGYALRENTLRALRELALYDHLDRAVAWARALPYQVRDEPAARIEELEALASELLAIVDERHYRRATGAA